MELKPFDKVLVRDSDSQTWSIDIFKKYDEEDKEYPYLCMFECYKQCIPYEGNESLFDTTTSLEPEYEFKDGDVVVVWNNGFKSKYVRVFNYKSSDSYITYNSPTGPMELWDNCIPFKTNDKE